MVSSIFNKLLSFIYRGYKFKNYIFYIILNRKLKMKRIFKRFLIFFKDIEIIDTNFPWIPIKAKIWLDHNLTAKMIIFEYGSGMSTLYFSLKVKKITSIEHNKNWYKHIKDKLKEKQVNNCEYLLIEPEVINNKISKNVDPKYISELKDYKKYHFKKYVKSIDTYPDNYFDLIFIDGRVRITCIKNSIKKIKSGGYLVLDNSDEKKYRSSQSILKNYKRLEFFDIALVNPSYKYSKISFWKTTIWQIK